MDSKVLDTQAAPVIDSPIPGDVEILGMDKAVSRTHTRLILVRSLTRQPDGTMHRTEDRLTHLTLDLWELPHKLPGQSQSRKRQDSQQ